MVGHKTEEGKKPRIKSGESINSRVSESTPIPRNQCRENVRIGATCFP